MRTETTISARLLGLVAILSVPAYAQQQEDILEGILAPQNPQQTQITDEMCDRAAAEENNAHLNACLQYYRNMATLRAERTAAITGEAAEWGAKQSLQNNLNKYNSTMAGDEFITTVRSKVQAGQLKDLPVGAYELLGIEVPQSADTDPPVQQDNQPSAVAVPPEQEPSLDTGQGNAGESVNLLSLKQWQQPAINVKAIERRPGGTLAASLSIRVQVFQGLTSSRSVSERWLPPVWRSPGESFGGGLITNIDLNGIVVDFGENKGRFRYDVAATN